VEEWFDDQSRDEVLMRRHTSSLSLDDSSPGERMLSWRRLLKSNNWLTFDEVRTDDDDDACRAARNASTRAAQRESSSSPSLARPRGGAHL
jgi:hypothetical protein